MFGGECVDFGMWRRGVECWMMEVGEGSSWDCCWTSQLQQFVHSIRWNYQVWIDYTIVLSVVLEIIAIK